MLDFLHHLLFFGTLPLLWTLHVSFVGLFQAHFFICIFFKDSLAIRLNFRDFHSNEIESI